MKKLKSTAKIVHLHFTNLTFQILKKKRRKSFSNDGTNDTTEFIIKSSFNRGSFDLEIENKLVNLNSKPEQFIDYLLSKGKNNFDEEDKNELIIEILKKRKPKRKSKYENFKKTLIKF